MKIVFVEIVVVFLLTEEIKSQTQIVFDEEFINHASMDIQFNGLMDIILLDASKEEMASYPGLSWQCKLPLDLHILFPDTLEMLTKWNGQQ